MKAKLIQDDMRQRFYELSQPITVGWDECRGHFDIAESERNACNGLRKKYQHYIAQVDDGIRVVCISDAFTHIERIVFTAYKMDDGKYRILTGVAIDGKMTMMIYGGDSRAVYKDEVYLRHLAMINRLKWEGIE